MTETQGHYTVMPMTATPAILVSEPMAEWEVRLVVHARLLRSAGKSVMFMVRFDGPAMTLWRILPDGRIE